MKNRAKLKDDTLAPEASVAFLIANDWQRGLNIRAI